MPHPYPWERHMCHYYCTCYGEDKGVAKISMEATLADWCLLHKMEPPSLYLIPDCIVDSFLHVKFQMTALAILHLSFPEPPSSYMLSQSVVEPLPEKAVLLSLDYDQNLCLSFLIFPVLCSLKS